MNPGRLAVLAAIAVLLCPSLAAGSKGERHFFFGPGPTTSCELDAGVPTVGTAAYCQTYPHAQSATLRADGSLKICHGMKCIGNPPEMTPTLVFGASLTTGPFRCTSLHTGIKCVVMKTGHGFLISPTTITKV